jgi:predicted nucleotidyltransferase
MTDYRGLLETLEKGGVDFILVGGLAATVHGSARLTQDVDVVYSRAPQNLTRLVAALGSIQPYLRGAPPNLPFRWDEETMAKGLNFTLSTKLGDLDLLGEIAGGGTFEELAEHAVTVRLFGIEIRCLDLPTLIRVKRAAGRPQDLEVVAELEALLEEGK